MPAHRTLRQTELAINLLIVSLSVFFAAAIVAVLLVSRRLPAAAGLPWSLWLATGCLAGASLTLHLAGRAVRRERQRALRRHLLTTAGLGIAFFAAQSWGLWELVSRHLQAEARTRLWILLSVLVALHAAHVLAGLGLLGVVCWRGCRGRLDHEYHLALTVAARYWHFLDVVWIAVLLVCLILVR